MTNYCLYVKPTNKCQLNCSHCYTNSSINDKDNFDVDKTIKWINEYIKSLNEDDKVLGSLHGGEPMIYDIESLNRIVDETKDKRLYWSATTNLVYKLKDEHLELFKKFIQEDGKPLVLTSYDVLIRFKDNQEELWKENVKYLLSQGINVKPIISLTSYVTYQAIKSIFELFVELGITSMNFERITSSGRAIDNPVRPTNENLDNLLYSVYNLWEREYRDKLDITLFNDIEKAFLDEYLTGCRKRECQKTVRTINPDGTIGGCPNSAPKETFLNINGEFNKEKYDESLMKEIKKQPNCYKCPYFKYCNGDCCQLEWDETGCPAPTKIYEVLIKRKGSK